MQFMLSIDIPPLPQPIGYTDGILLTGSCFTEHMADRLAQHKFSILSNPHGILFNPLSVASSLNSYLDGRQYTENDLFYLNELWNSWDHHTRFSHTTAAATLQAVNASQQQAARFIRTAGWVVITLGSAFQYYHKESGLPVSNNHRAPAQWFEKRLLSSDEITIALSHTLTRLREVNPGAQVLFTISPVRHIRDGVVDNNRSKARLIEAVHTLCAAHAATYYFPAYELLIDVLRDYRFYDVDMVHPNYAGTTHVWEQFVKTCISPSITGIMQQVQEIATACAHRPRFPDTDAHKKFRASYAARIAALISQHPYLNLENELKYFGGQ